MSVFLTSPPRRTQKPFGGKRVKPHPWRGGVTSVPRPCYLNGVGGPEDIVPHHPSMAAGCYMTRTHDSDSGY